MISFRSFLSLLMENRIEFLKMQHPAFDVTHDQLAKLKNSHDIIDHFASHDPSRKKIYTQWILNQYKKKNIRQEDGPKIANTLSNFERYKSKLKANNQPTDINQYERLSDLNTALEPHLETHASKKEEKKFIRHSGAQEIYNDPAEGITVHHVKTEAAACQYGKGTQWCTAGDDYNAFDEYNEKGKIHILHDHKNGRKYQFHANTGQFMDENDNPINARTYKSLVQRSPGLKDIEDFKALEFPFLDHGKAKDKLFHDLSYKIVHDPEDEYGYSPLNDYLQDKNFHGTLTHHDLITGLKRGVHPSEIQSLINKPLEIMPDHFTQKHGDYQYTKDQVYQELINHHKENLSYDDHAEMWFNSNKFREHNLDQWFHQVNLAFHIDSRQRSHQLRRTLDRIEQNSYGWDPNSQGYLHRQPELGTFFKEMEKRDPNIIKSDLRTVNKVHRMLMSHMDHMDKWHGGAPNDSKEMLERVLSYKNAAAGKKKK